MQLTTRHFVTAAALTAAIVPALARQRHGGVPDSDSEHVRRIEPQRAIEVPLAVGPACGLAPVAGSFAGTAGPLVTNGSSVNTFTTLVTTLDSYLWDIDLRTTITHTECQDLDVTLTSPAGTVVTITTDNGGTLDNLFNGTLFDDNVNDPLTDKLFANNVVVASASPEGRLQAFRGEDPNGTWTLTIVDDTVTDSGTLTSWSLDISTLAAPPVASTASFPKVAGLAFGPGPATTNDTVLVSGVGTFLLEAELFITVPHSFSFDLEISLSSALGPAVKVTTFNGSVFANVFNGSLFDADAPVPVTDAVYVNSVAETPISPEGAFDNWLGQDPNGTWTLSVVDAQVGLGGTLVDWTVGVTTIPAPAPSAPVNYAGTAGPILDATSSVAFTFSSIVSGMPAYLWDVDLSTSIAHTSNADLDITLTSPAGTVVVITTDNGGINDDVYNGTLWDDDVNAPVTDAAFANAVTATPLSPEGRLAAFRGEDPNGTWTLTIVDDVASTNNGNLSGWSLGIAALAGAPPSASNTYSQVPGLAIPDAGTVSDILAVVDPGTSITEVELTLDILHTECADLDITLTSPGGTTVKVTTDNGGANDNVYNGTVFDPGLSGALAPVSDAVYANNVTETPISPEGSFDNFLGQNPTGNWTLTVTDDLATDVGALVRWSLTIRTCSIPPPLAYCFGDGSGALCPCSPAPVPHGDAGKGCPSNLSPGGAQLVATGLASIGADTLVLTASGMPNGGGCLIYQGTGDNGGAGTVFGDGLRCANGAVARMKTHIVVLNAAQYPDPGFGDNSISQRGGVLMPGSRYYQGWYRSANPAFCTPDLFNLTNGVKVTWGL